MVLAGLPSNRLDTNRQVFREKDVQFFSRIFSVLNEEAQGVTTRKERLIKAESHSVSYSKTDPVGAKVKVNSCKDISNSP